jgi:hypothetical protein
MDDKKSTIKKNTTKVAKQSVKCGKKKKSRMHSTLKPVVSVKTSRPKLLLKTKTVKAVSPKHAYDSEFDYKTSDDEEFNSNDTGYYTIKEQVLEVQRTVSSEDYFFYNMCEECEAKAGKPHMIWCSEKGFNTKVGEDELGDYGTQKPIFLEDSSEIEN